jgi:SAM-dependent methyltransferase
MKYSANTELHTSRGVLDYKSEMEIDAYSLRGKSVLDIGAGRGSFQEQCIRRGIDVIALDPLYRNPSGRGNVFKRHLKNPKLRKSKVAGINETLPFKNCSFDCVLSSYSSFHHLHDNYPDRKTRRVMTKKMFEEMLRVLKPDGEARIAGMFLFGKEKELYETMLTKIVDESYDASKVSWKFITVPKVGEYLVLNRTQ